MIYSNVIHVQMNSQINFKTLNLKNLSLAAIFTGARSLLFFRKKVPCTFNKKKKNMTCARALKGLHEWGSERDEGGAGSGGEQREIRIFGATWNYGSKFPPPPLIDTNDKLAIYTSPRHTHTYTRNLSRFIARTCFTGRIKLCAKVDLYVHGGPLLLLHQPK